VDQLGPNALGEALEPGRVPDCYLGLLLPPGPAGEPEPGTILVVAPAGLLHPRVPRAAGSLVYELLTGHPEREADLANHLRNRTSPARLGTWVAAIASVPQSWSTCPRTASAICVGTPIG
jgi:hypothetical protein